MDGEVLPDCAPWAGRVREAFPLWTDAGDGDAPAAITGSAGRCGNTRAGIHMFVPAQPPQLRTVVGIVGAIHENTWPTETGTTVR